MADPVVTYESKMTREQWRTTFIRCELTSPPHKAALRWLSAACAELHDVAEVSVDAVGGQVRAKGFKDGRGDEVVPLKLTRDAVQGIKLAATMALTSAGGKPASLLERASILASLKYVGPEGVLMRKVTAEAELPDSKDLDEDELDLEPAKDKKEA